MAKGCHTIHENHANLEVPDLYKYLAIFVWKGILTDFKNPYNGNEIAINLNVFLSLKCTGNLHIYPIKHTQVQNVVHSWIKIKLCL